MTMASPTTPVSASASAPFEGTESSPSMEETILMQRFVDKLLEATQQTTISREFKWCNTDAKDRQCLDLSNETIQGSLSFLQKDFDMTTVTATVRLSTVLIHRGNMAPNAGGKKGNISNGSQQAGKVLHQLAQRILSNIKLSMQRQDHETTDGCNDRSVIIQTARWYLQLLFHIVEPIAGLNTVCATVWRSLGDISTAISRAAIDTTDHKSSGTGEIRSSDIDHQFCARAMERIYVLIREGFQAAVDGNHKHGQERGQSQQAAKMGKLLKFFFMRLIQLIHIVPFHNQTNGGARDVDSVLSLDNHLLPMMEFRGFVLRNRDSLGIDSAKQLVLKIKGCVENLLGGGNDVDVHGQNLFGKYHPTALNSLLKLTCGHGSTSLNISDFWLGKLETVTDIFAGIQSNKIKINNDCGIAEISSSQWEMILSLCENLVFLIIPMCYELFTCKSFGYVFSNGISALGDMLMLLESTPMKGKGKKKSIRSLHRWIIYCLANTPGNPQRKERKIGTASTHPIASQLCMFFAQTYIVRSFFRHSTNNIITASKETTSSSNYCSLVRIMSRIIFDKRTSRTLRRNIGIVFYRLLQTSCPDLNRMRNLVESTLISSYVGFLSNVKDKRSSLKRKRDDSTLSIWLNLEGVIEIAPLINLISSSENLASKLSTDAMESLIEDFETILMTTCDNEDKKKKTLSKIAKEAPGLLCIISSIVEGSRLSKLSESNKNAAQFNILLASIQPSSSSEKDLGLFRLARHRISNMKQMPKKQWQRLLKIMNILPPSQASVQSKHGASIVMSSFDMVLSLNSSQAAASLISSNYTSLLSSNDTSILLSAMSSLEVFASKVPPSNKHLLPHCIPKSCQQLLQCRLKGELYCFISRKIARISSPKLLFERRSEEGKTLASLFRLEILSKNYIKNRSILGPSNVAVVPGSRIISLQNPKGSNASAILILPPEAEGIEISDIINWRQCEKE